MVEAKGAVGGNAISTTDERLARNTPSQFFHARDGKDQKPVKVCVGCDSSRTRTALVKTPRRRLFQFSQCQQIRVHHKVIAVINDLQLNHDTAAAAMLCPDTSTLLVFTVVIVVLTDQATPAT